MRVPAAPTDWSWRVNGFDLAVAAGYTKDYMQHRFPLVLGKDFAGEVDALGAGVTGYAVGDRVFGTVTKPYLGDGVLRRVRHDRHRSRPCTTAPEHLLH